jgi:hypothetical protein
MKHTTKMLIILAFIKYVRLFLRKIREKKRGEKQLTEFPYPSNKKTKSSLGPCAPRTRVFSISAVRLGPVTVQIIEG